MATASACGDFGDGQCGYITVGEFQGKNIETTAKCRDCRNICIDGIMMEIVKTRQLELIFGVQDFHFLIQVAQVKYRGETT